MPPTNQAALLHTPQQKPFHLTPIPLPTPSPTQLLIQTHALAINPCDAIIQNLGVLWPTYPLIIGSDLAGTILAVGSHLVDDDFSIGDRVLACVEHGAFQQFCVVDPELVVKIPGNVRMRDAVVLPLGMATAAVGLFEKGNMGLRLPSGEERGGGGLVLVWGASSSVGSCAAQMLVAAGYVVAAVAGGSNAEYCRELGARYVFDHRNADVEKDIVSTLQTADLEFAGVFSAITDKMVLQHCVHIAVQLGGDEKSRIVGTVIPPNMPMFPLPEVPAGVRLAFCAGPSDLLKESKLREICGWEKKELSEVGPRIFGKWMTDALESGALKCRPEPFVVGKGLEFVQEACDLMSKGVSARKLVVELV